MQKNAGGRTCEVLRRRGTRRKKQDPYAIQSGAYTPLLALVYVVGISRGSVMILVIV